MESRTQGSRPRPRTQKKSEAKAKDSLSEDRHSRGQGQECSRPRPRTQALVLSKQKKKRSSQKFFKQSLQENVFQKIFQVLYKILTVQKILLSSSRGQANFRGLEASRPRPRTSKCVLEAKNVLEDSTSVAKLLKINGNTHAIFKIACFGTYVVACLKLIYCYKSKIKIETIFYENKQLDE